MTVKNFSHSGNSGDIIASLPALFRYHELTGIKPNLYLVQDRPAYYYEGAVHPVKDKEGQNVSMNEEMVTKIIPLLQSQPYLDVVKKHEEEEIHVDLCEIRNTFVNMPYGSISRWYFYTMPDLACDLSKPYLFIPETEKDYGKGKIIISRSERYQNTSIDYSFLKKYEDDLLFVGTMREYNNFCMGFDLEIPKLAVDNFLQLAQAIKQSRFHISNQTFTFQISEMLKKPRVAELCSYAPNVIPVGEDAYDFYAQQAIEYYVDYLAKKYPA